MLKGFLKIFIILSFCMVGNASNAQQQRILGDVKYLSQPDSLPWQRVEKFTINRWKGSSSPEVVPLTPVKVKGLAPDYILQQWGIFCVGEYRLQQKTGLPLRFRLGSLEYVNRLEGK